MNEDRELVRLFAEINKKGNKITYHKESWEGPKVTPRRFYPSRLIKLVRGKSKEHSKKEYVPDSFELKTKAPKDDRINAYVLGDENYFSMRRFASISQPPPGPNYTGRIEVSESFGREDTDQHLVCVSYCMISQRDLKKNQQPTSILPR